MGSLMINKFKTLRPEKKDGTASALKTKIPIGFL